MQGELLALDRAFLRIFRLTSKLEAANLDLGEVTEGKRQYPLFDVVLREYPW